MHYGSLMPKKKHSPPICCIECGKEYRGGLIYAKREGWQGFTRNVSVGHEDGTRRIEHLGKCPECKQAAVDSMEKGE